MGNSARIEWEAGNLRHRVALGDFAGAEASARCYCDLVAHEIRGLPRAEAEDCLHRSAELLEWARRNLCAARTRIALQLGRLGRASLYRAAKPRRATHTWKIEA